MIKQKVFLESGSGIKNTFSVGEDMDFLEINLISVWDHFFGLPKEFLRELEEFGKRNSFFVERRDEDFEEVECKICARCFKAHLIMKAKEYNVNHKVTQFLASQLPCRAGHGDYYLDGDNVFPFSLV